jgi:hypothetical protein
MGHNMILHKGFLFALIIMLMAGCSPFGVIVAGGGGGEPPAQRAPKNESPASYRTLNIPPGHLPPAGKCKIWYPGKPPGHQGPPMSCDAALRQAPADAWVISRAQNDTRILEVRERKSGPRVEIIIRKYLID